MTAGDHIAEKLREFAGSTGEIMTLPALKGRLGGVEFFVITLSLGKLSRYIEATDSNLPAKLRENRRARPERFAEIATYIVSNPDSYRFSAITCTYGKNGTEKPLKWRPADPDAPEGTPYQMIGELTLDQGDPLIIVDGQHRLGAIRRAIEIEPELRNESIAIVLFPYLDIEAAQQLFSDLNRNAKKTSKSLDVYFDRRPIFNRAVQKVVDKVSVFKNRVDLENISVAKSPVNVFTLAGVYQASEPMIKAAPDGKLVQAKLHEDNQNEDVYVDFLADAWEFIAEQFPEWGKVASGEMNIAQQRQAYIHWNSGVVSSIGEFVGTAMRERSDNWKDAVKVALSDPENGNWRRDSPRWEGIVVAGNQVLPRSAVRIQLIAYLKFKAGLRLRDSEEEVLKKMGFRP